MTSPEWDTRPVNDRPFLFTGLSWLFCRLRSLEVGQQA